MILLFTALFFNPQFVIYGDARTGIIRFESCERYFITVDIKVLILRYY